MLHTECWRSWDSSILKRWIILRTAGSGNGGWPSQGTYEGDAAGTKYCEGATDSPGDGAPLNDVHPTFPFMLALSQATTETLLEKALNELGGAVERHLVLYFDAHRDGLPAAGLYDLIPPSADKQAKPVGEWNEGRIVGQKRPLLPKPAKASSRWAPFSKPPCPQTG